MYYIISIIITLVAFCLGAYAGFNLGESMESLRKYDEDANH